MTMKNTDSVIQSNMHVSCELYKKTGLLLKSSSSKKTFRSTYQSNMLIKRIHCKKQCVHWNDQIQPRNSLYCFISSSTSNRMYSKAICHAVSLVSSRSPSSAVSSSSSSCSTSSTSTPSPSWSPSCNSSSFSSYSSLETIGMYSNHNTESDNYSSSESENTFNNSLRNKQSLNRTSDFCKTSMSSESSSTSSSLMLSNQVYTCKKCEKVCVNHKRKL
ncbi:unnamed protein product [Schistosoma turkestanicum]|nr:unnamed protein product [Schistosoma turkestanicum]